MTPAVRDEHENRILFRGALITKNEKEGGIPMKVEITKLLTSVAGVANEG